MNCRRFFQRARADNDHAQEFQSFLEIETDENMARGLSPEAARRAAYLKFGNPTAIREEVYEMNSIRCLETLGRDIRYAWRVLKAAPTFTVVSLLTLALGIGATTAIFTVVNGVILRPLPYPEPERLVTAWETNPTYNMPGHPPGSISFSPGNYLDLRDQNRSFEQIGAFSISNFNVTGGGAPERLTGALASAGFFTAFGIRSELGRLLAPADDSPGAERVVVISHSLWQERFGGSDTVIGKSIVLDDRSHIVIGVMPAAFRVFDSDVDVWLPLERKIAPEDMRWRQSYYLRVIARLKPGVSVAQAGEDVDRVVQTIRRAHADDVGKGGMVVPLLDNTIARARGPLLILLGAVGFVLMIACANVAHLSLGRAIARQREIALRLALGVGRARLVRQLFTESLLLAVGGAATGLLFAEAGVRALLRLAPAEIPRAAEIHIDTWALGFAAAAAIASGIVFGLLPALACSKRDLQEGLKGGGRSASAGPGAQLVRAGLVISEIAVALVLMIGAGLMIESFRRVSAVDPGFDARGLVTMRVAPSPIRYDAVDRQNGFYQRIINRFRGLPGVSSVGAIDGLPFSDGGFDNAFSIDGRPPQPVGHPLKADIRRIDPGYFGAMGINLLEGRTFTQADRTGAPTAAIISKSMTKYWPNESAIGKRLAINFGPPGGIKAAIVGVAADVHSALDQRPNDIIYMHYPQGMHIAQMDLLVRLDERSQVTASTLAGAARAAVVSIDPDQPVYRIRTMQETLSASLASRRFQTFLLTLFATFAACLAAVGLYGVLAYSVQTRTREIGIRCALGAQNSQVSGMILREALKLTAIGVTAGVAGALGLTRLLLSLLYDVRPADAPVFIAVSLLLLTIAATAAYIPARKAARIDPLIALRHE